LDRYTIIGFVVTILGIVYSFFSFYIISSIPSTAVGISIIILGINTILIPGSSISKNYVYSIFMESYSNIEALLLQFDMKERCVYLPPKDKKVFAFVPLNIDLDPSKERKVRESPIRMVTHYQGMSGLMVFLPLPYDILSELPEGMKAEKTLNIILVDQLTASGSVKAVEFLNKIIVRISGFQETTELPSVQSVFGSIPTSIAGSALSFVYNKPIILLEEKLEGNDIIDIFEVSTKHG